MFQGAQLSNKSDLSRVILGQQAANIFRLSLWSLCLIQKTDLEPAYFQGKGLGFGKKVDDSLGGYLCYKFLRIDLCIIVQSRSPVNISEG